MGIGIYFQKKVDGFKIETRKSEKYLKGIKQTHDYLISNGESKQFLRVPDKAVDKIKEHYETPEGFECWVREMRESDQDF